MNERQLKIYLFEILHQIEAVKLAVGSYNLALARKDTSGVPYAFAATQSFLDAIAIISKLLWPMPDPKYHIDGTLMNASEKQDARHRADLRGEVLRHELGEEEINALDNLKNKEVRNGLEHFDERLDQYLFEAGENADIIDRNIMPIGSIVISGNTNPLTLRNIDPTAKTISVLDKRANMQILTSSIDKLEALCSQRLAKS